MNDKLTKENIEHWRELLLNLHSYQADAVNALCDLALQALKDADLIDGNGE